MENQRVRLSKMLLKNALMKLLKEKPLEKITIYELCAEAQLNRVTFYKYYGSQYDLLTDIENDCFRKLEEILSVRIARTAYAVCWRLCLTMRSISRFLSIPFRTRIFQPSCSICPLSGSSLTWRFPKPLQRKKGTSFAFSSIKADMQ